MEDDNRNILYQDYSATCLGMIGRMMGGEDWTLQSFVEMAYPEDKKVNDKRTADEIIRDLIERLG